jgi:hypothetical protein
VSTTNMNGKHHVLLYPVTCFFSTNEEHSYSSAFGGREVLAIGPVMASANARMRKRVAVRAIMVMVCQKSNI